MIDAPNLFTSRVDEILVAQDIRPTCSEPNIYLNMGTVAVQPVAPSWVKRGTGGGNVAARATLNLMVSAHMDDFKAIGPQSFLNWLRDVLTKAFGGRRQDGAGRLLHPHWHQAHPYSSQRIQQVPSASWIRLNMRVQSSQSLFQS